MALVAGRLRLEEKDVTAQHRTLVQDGPASACFEQCRPLRMQSVATSTNVEQEAAGLQPSRRRIVVTSTKVY